MSFVQMKVSLIILLMFSSCVMTPALAEDIGKTVVTWKPPVERTDNTELVETEIAYYSIYCAPYPPPLWFYLSTPFTVDRIEVEKEDLGWYCETYWCGLTVTDTEARESGFSNIVSIPGLCK